MLSCVMRAQDLRAQDLSDNNLKPFTGEPKGRQDIYAKGFRSFSVSPEIETLDFRLPAELEAGEPPEARGLSRDQVRLMAS